MADKVAERSDRKMYGLVYTRATRGRSTQNAIAKDDDLIIGSLPNEKMKKVSAGSSTVVKDGEREPLSEHCVGNVEGKEGTKRKTLKEDLKAEYSKKRSRSGKVLLAGYGKVELNTLPKEESKNINTPIKQKKGADGEMVSSYLLSTEKSLSRLRPRKEVPAFRIVDLEDDDNEIVVGKRVKIYWSGSRRWFTGRIEAFDKKKRLHSILYDDGDKEVLDLRKERFELEVLPTDPFKLKIESHSARKADGLDVEDTGSVGEVLMEENSKNVNGAKTVVKSSKSKQKKEAMKEAERTQAVKGSVQAINDDSLNIKISELAERPNRSRKGLVPRVKRMRTNKVLSSDFDNVVEKQEADINSHNVKDERKVQAGQTEFAATNKKSEDESVAGITSAQRPGDVHSMEASHEAESMPEAESMKHCEASYPLQPFVQIGPEEAKPKVFQRKAKLENGSSDKEFKEGVDFISKKPSSKKSKSNDGAAS
ncbi:hypothetical protein COLO4_06118 [Corchorus olitorius]|uniref:Tudor domain-containing protein n=1 Tax=Corchorus olitorius TaxID=93759 RepID=A0A1R3KNW1_9ROSI|nr:hypothetical protein COLO4_06118 [Corchorus olitorius]